MRFYLIFCFILLFAGSSVSGQYYGMQFHAHEFSLDQRSGLNLTPERALDIKENLELQFHLRLDPDHESYFGYVFRLILDDQNIDLIHGIFPENPNNFELILGDKTSKIAFQVPIEELLNEWLKLRFEFDFKNHQVTCYVNDKVLTDDLIDFNEKNGFRLMFGAHSIGNFSSTDLPTMILRDVEVECGKQNTYRWPLNETEGNIAHSVPKGYDGVAMNPEWLLKRHNTWDQVLELDISGDVKTAYNARNDDLYILSQDSVYIFDVVNQLVKRIPLKVPYPIDGTFQILFDTISNKLVKYSLDNHYTSDFDAETGMWSFFDTGTQDPTAYWHHNRFMAPDGSIIALGGYGYFQYRNSLLAWNPETNHFDQVTYKGDFNPRYLAGSGFNPLDSLYYIIGGYGSESGKQSESPDYYYEILSYSLSDHTFTKVHEFENTQAGFCYANSVIFDDSNNLYALYFDKYQFSNKLQLVRIPLDNPELFEVGNDIDYSFLDVDSYSDLFYSRRSSSLLTLSSYTSENTTTLLVHSIAFPPQKYIVKSDASTKDKPNVASYIIIAVLLLVTFILIYTRTKKKRKPEKKPVQAPREAFQKSEKNSIILFGGFQVIDKNGKDITAQFTPLPKKIFLFILLHSLRNNKGVSSNTMYETFWFDKSVESARNNRAVNIVKLKSLMENLDTATISKETGYWKFDFDPSHLHVDYHEYFQIVNGSKEPSREDIIDLQSIIENKPFLNNTNADWLDPFKSEVSNEIIDTFLKYIGSSEDDPEFILHLTKCIFLFDAVSEEALKVQCKLLIKQGKHTLAKKAYSSFINEYKQLYDEDYGLSFNQVMEDS